MDQYIVSARKYRPATFASVVGQKALSSTLKNAVVTQRLASSYLFCGSRGVGKTTCARIFAKAINCEHLTADGEPCNECPSCRAFNANTSLNIIEMDAASNNGVEDIRALVKQVQVPPSSGRYRVFIIDEVHMLTQAAFNAFLKTLEEPPAYVVFILATTEKQKIIPTILSRCQIYDFHRITVPDMVEHLQYVASNEGIQAEPAALNVIARKADGAMRDALSIFDQIAASTRGNITFRATLDNLNMLDSGYYSRLLDAFLEGRVLDTWMTYKEIRDRGFDSLFFINGLGDYFRDLMAASTPETLSLIEGTDEMRRQLQKDSGRCKPEMLLQAMTLCNDADLQYRTASGKQFLIELTLAKICQLSSPSPADGGQDEGQLKPIAAAVAPTAAQTPAPAPVTAPAAKPLTPAAGTLSQPAAQPQTQPQPAASFRQAPPAPAPARRSRTVIKAPAISISGRNASHPAPGTTDTAGRATTSGAATRRDSAFTDEQMQRAWDSYIESHPRDHVIINAMRTARPVATPDAATYTATVLSPIQRDMLAEALPQLLAHLRDSLSNDSVTINIAVAEGPAPRYTLNDRELLATMVKEHPFISNFIETFKLNL